MEPWVLELLACSFDGCGGDLDVQPGGVGVDGRLLDGVLSCVQCEAPYPVLGGVPIVVPLASDWLARYRESALASLAEYGLASRMAVTLVETFVEPAGPAEPMRFGDDWTADHAAEIQPVGGTEHADEFASFVHGARDRGPDSVLSALLGGGPLGTVLEVGCGDGAMACRLRHGAERVLVADISLRAVLLAMARSVEDGPGPPVAGAVMDAEALAVRDGSADTVVAASLVDLLDRPRDFLGEAARVLGRGGRLVLSTPEPDGIDEGVADAGLVVRRAVDGVPWLRAHSPRYFQVYLVRALVADKPG